MHPSLYYDVKDLKKQIIDSYGKNLEFLENLVDMFQRRVDHDIDFLKLISAKLEKYKAKLNDRKHEFMLEKYPTLFKVTWDEIYGDLGSFTSCKTTRYFTTREKATKFIQIGEEELSDMRKNFKMKQVPSTKKMFKFIDDTTYCEEKFHLLYDPAN